MKFISLKPLFLCRYFKFFMRPSKSEFKKFATSSSYASTTSLLNSFTTIYINQNVIYIMTVYLITLNVPLLTFYVLNQSFCLLDPNLKISILSFHLKFSFDPLYFIVSYSIYMIIISFYYHLFTLIGCLLLK